MHTTHQGWARDVNGRDRDETETFGLTSRDETETRRWNFETRLRRDVCRSRDVTETLKCTFIVTRPNAIRLKQVNVGLTTVAILSPHVRLFHCRYTARRPTWPCTRPSARPCTRSCTLLCTGRKHGHALRAVYTAVYVTGRLHGPVHGTAVYMRPCTGRVH